MNNITLLQYCVERFEPYLESSSFSDGTKSGYRNCILRCSNELLNSPMASVTDDGADNALKWLTEKSHTANTVNYTRYALRCCWRLAVEDGVVSSNPFQQTKKTPPRDTHKYFSDEELRKLEQVIPYYCEPELFLTALYSTLRKNYIFGLQIGDVPDEGTTLTVLHSGTIYPKRQCFCLTDLSTPIDYQMNSKAMACLRKAKHRQLYMKSIHGDGFNNQNLLFPDKSGHPYLASRIVEYVDLIREASGVFHFGFLEIYTHNIKHGGLSVID